MTLLSEGCAPSAACRRSVDSLPRRDADLPETDIHALGVAPSADAVQLLARTMAQGAGGDAALGLDTRPRRREGVVGQEAGESLVLLDVDSGLYFSLDEVGYRIWSLCDGRTVGEIVDAICGEYDVDRARVESDALDLLRELSAEALVAYE